MAALAVNCIYLTYRGWAGVCRHPSTPYIWLSGLIKQGSHAPIKGVFAGWLSSIRHFASPQSESSSMVTVSFRVEDVAKLADVLWTG